MNLEYIKYIVIGIFILALSGFLGWYIYSNNKLNQEISQLKVEIATYKAQGDTIYIKGKDSTVYKTKVLHDTLIVDKTKDIDTTVTEGLHSVRLTMDSLLVKLYINCRDSIKEIIRVDTLKIPKLVEVQIPPKPIAWYNTKEIWFGYGVVATTVIIKILSK